MNSMQSQTFEASTRGTVAGLSRRRSLLTLGVAALATRLTRPEVGAAKKKGKGCKKKEQQRCSQDTALCKALFTPCPLPPEVCAAILACCDNIRPAAGRMLRWLAGGRRGDVPIVPTRSTAVLFQGRGVKT